MGGNEEKKSVRNLETEWTKRSKSALIATSVCGDLLREKDSALPSRCRAFSGLSGDIERVTKRPLRGPVGDVRQGGRAAPAR